MFDHICNFKINSSGLDLDEIELDLIDFGAEEVFLDGDNVMIYAPFQYFGALQSSNVINFDKVTNKLSLEQHLMQLVAWKMGLKS